MDYFTAACCRADYVEVVPFVRSVVPLLPQMDLCRVGRRLSCLCFGTISSINPGAEALLASGSKVPFQLVSSGKMDLTCYSKKAKNTHD